MKTKIMLSSIFLLIFITLKCKPQTPQKKLWTFNNNSYNFAISSFQNLTSTSANLAINSMYDVNGNILFYIVDSYVYKLFRN